MRLLVVWCVCLCFLLIPYACSPTENRPEPKKEQSQQEERMQQEPPFTTDAGERTAPEPEPNSPPEEPIVEPVFNPNLGKIKWTTDIPGASINSLALHPLEKELFVSAGGTLSSLNVENGEEKWRLANLGKALSAPTVDHRGNIVIGSDTKRVYQLKPGKQKWNWSFDTMEAAHKFAPALDPQGTVYIPAGNTLYAITNGANKWQTHYDMGAKASSSPSVAQNGTIYICSVDNQLHAVSSEGKQLWIKGVGKAPCTNIAIDLDGSIFVGSNLLQGFDAKGNNKFEAQTQYGNITTHVVIHREFLYFGTFRGKLFKVDKATGKKSQGPRWDEGIAVISNGSLDFAPTIGAAGFIYLGHASPSLEAFDPATGKNRWAISAASRSAFIGHPVIAKNGTLFAGTEGGTIFAVGTDSPGLANPWAKGLQSNQNNSLQFQ